MDGDASDDAVHRLTAAQAVAQCVVARTKWMTTAPEYDHLQSIDGVLHLPPIVVVENDHWFSFFVTI